MQWSVCYFMHKTQVWEEHRKNALVDNKYGAAVYAARQSAKWSDMACHADQAFDIDTLYTSPLV